jgi:hypothetical protein
MEPRREKPHESAASRDESPRPVGNETEVEITETDEDDTIDALEGFDDTVTEGAEVADD